MGGGQYWILRREMPVLATHFHAKANLEGIPEMNGLLKIPVICYNCHGGLADLIRRKSDKDNYMADLAEAVENNPEKINHLMDMGFKFNKDAMNLTRTVLGSEPSSLDNRELRFLLLQFEYVIPKTWLYSTFIPYYCGDVKGFEDKIDAEKAKKLRLVSAHKEAEPAVLKLASEILRRNAFWRGGGNYGSLTFAELARSIYGRPPDAGELRERYEHCYIECFPGKCRVHTGADARRRETLALGAAPDAKELKGMPAFGGKLAGKAFVARRAEDMKIMRRGRILVTHMTTVNFVPFIRKAAAIVTDEGGVTSHAAVMSREFRIPCIVGVHHATRTIKTDDRIEIDAYKGVVRKIS